MNCVVGDQYERFCAGWQNHLRRELAREQQFDAERPRDGHGRASFVSQVEGGHDHRVGT
jgi:hypothetical protein